MVVREERESLLRSLKGYLQDLADSGLDELPFAESHLPSSSGRGAGVRVAPDAAPGAAIPQERRRVEPHSEEVPAEPAAGQDCRVEGNPRARLLFVGHGTGFSGAAGELLEKIVIAMRRSKEQVCLLSFDTVSGAAADPLAARVADRIASLAPEVIVTLGEAATRMLLQSDEPMEQLRGTFLAFRGIPTMPTFHPEAMLADETLKRDVWNDMKQVMQRLERQP